MRSVLITGVSSGIGHVATSHFLNKGWRVFGSVRKESDAIAFEGIDQFIPLIFDVTDRSAIENAREKVLSVLGENSLDVLVNNAGIANYGPLVHIPAEKFRENLEVNVTGALEVTQVFFPLLNRSSDTIGSKGRIINIGSVSGRFVMPLLGPYCASKYALVALSHALRRELLIHGIPVSLIEPASAESDIWNKARHAETYVEGTAFAHIDGMKSDLIDKQEKRALPTQKVVDVIWKAATSKTPRARYLVTPNNFVNRFVFSLPDKWVDNIFNRAFNRANANDV